MNHNKLATLCFTIILSLLTLNASAAALDLFSGEQGELRIAGGTAHVPVMKIAAQRIMTANPAIHISIAGGGSGVGIKQVGEGLVAIGNAGREATPAEIDRYGLVMYRWAVDGVAVVVNPANPVRNLTQEQLAAIFSGEISDWSVVGGADKQINLYTRDAASGTRSVFWKKALEKGVIAKSANFVASNGAMKASIAQDPAAIGYVSAGHIDNSVAAVAFNGIEPSPENIKAGRYPIARGLYSNTRGEATGLAKKLIDYLLTTEGQKIVTEKGFVAVR